MNYLVNDSVQPKEVTAHCFGDCRKVKVGVVRYMGMNWVSCQEADCTYMEREQVDGDVTLRKLRQSLPEREA